MTHETRALVRHLLPAIGFTACLAPALAGCQAPEGKADKPIPAELQPYVLDAVPADVAHRTLIDFENRMQLVAYDLEPEGVVDEGAKVTLSLYWQPLERLEADAEGRTWAVFTELLDGRGRPHPDGRVAASGTLRGSLPLAEWRPGKIYLDESEMTLPDPLWSSEVLFAVGFERQWDYPVLPDGAGGAGPGDSEAADDGADSAEEQEVETKPLPMRLKVVSGPSDRQGRGIVTVRQTNFDPQVAKKKAAARAAAEKEAASRRGRRRPPPGAAPPGARRPSLRGAPGMPGRPSPQGAPGMQRRPQPGDRIVAPPPGGAPPPARRPPPPPAQP